MRHSLSPALHNAAFEQLGLDWVYTTFEVAPGRSAEALAAMRTLGLGGLSVTMPHKEDVAEAVDSLDPAAAALRSVNAVVPRPRRSLKGYSTDGAGFVASLAAAGETVVGRSVCLLGGGGAARALANAFAAGGRGERGGRQPHRCRGGATAALAGSVGAVGRAADLTAADIVVNATSVGMGSDELPCDADLFTPVRWWPTSSITHARRRCYSGTSGRCDHS